MWHFTTVLKAIHLPWPQKRLLIETLVLLAFARLGVLLLPFRWVARLLGKEMAEAQELDNPAHTFQIRRISAMVRRVARHVPWTSKCLDQAIAAKIMLARRGIPATVYFGVKHDEKGELAAHAWSRSGNRYVTGGDIRDQFTIINTFA